jgi:hypothetical protein
VVLMMVTAATFTAVATPHALVIILTVSHDLLFHQPLFVSQIIQLTRIRTPINHAMPLHHSARRDRTEPHGSSAVRPSLRIAAMFHVPRRPRSRIRRRIRD